MSKYAPLILRTIAAITSATSAAAAYPAAANLFGMFPGGVMVASSAAAIYAGWHIVATSENTDYRIVSGVTAALFAGVMTVGIHSSGQLKTATQATSAAEQADILYANQESTRMATLATVAAELRATQKSKYPAEYAALQAQVDKLSRPTPRVETATQAATPTTNGLYPWVVAGLLEVVSPALLLLAGMFTRRETLDTPRTRAGHATEKPDTLPDTKTLKASCEAVDTLPDTLDTGENGSETYRYAEPYETALTGIRNRSVSTTDAGNVTRQAVQDYAKCTKQDAMYAMGLAVQEGYLEKSGDGANTRYRYAKQTLRAVK
ncbi:MAG: hypothetical protein QJT81_14180 [Candidatus Thiothrix putei]|uniref:Uncharacterized protein n=1 Tax=Candidatus Thiothrix putei TaxID=3080811 RepID=A0AA95KH21_9GAMM|nr:MAG: hypothetical protein QJT81_14180 [Candidatus Thiothrix putei]